MYNRNEDSINYVLLHDNALLLLRVVLTRVLAPTGLCVQWLVSRRRLIALVLARLAPLMLLLVVLTRVLAPLAHLLQWLVSRCWLIALVLARLTPILLLFIVLILQVRSQLRISQTGTSEQAANKQPTSSQQLLCFLT